VGEGERKGGGGGGREGGRKEEEVRWREGGLQGEEEGSEGGMAGGRWQAGEEGRRCILTFTTVILAMLPLFTSNGAVPLGRKI